MGVTVDAAFKLIDRASRPMERMERQARKTERAARSAGESMDTIGSPQQVKQMDQASARTRRLAGDNDRLARSMGTTTREVRRLDRGVQGLTGRLSVLGGAFRAVKMLAMPALFLAIASAIKPLLGAVGALGGGAVALAGSLGSLGGAAAALPAIFLGIGGAVGVAKFAMGDLSKAMGGNKEAIKNLTPEARSFMRTLKQYAPVVKDLRREAGKGLFPGLEVGLKRIQKGVPMATVFLRNMGKAVGDAAKQWSSFLTQGDNLVDFASIGRQGVKTFDRIQRGARNVSAAIIDIVRTAEPFTDWLTKTMLGWTKSFRNFIQQSRENGKLAAFFDNLRKRMALVFSITGHLFKSIMSIFKAATPLGDDMLRTFDKMTGRWAKFLAGTRGQGDLRRYFDSLRPTLHELAGLTGDLFKMMGRLMGTGAQGDATKFVAGVRTLVPVLEDILNSASKFAPDFINGLRTVGHTIDTLVGQGSSPLVMLLRTLTTILGAVNSLVDAFPALGRVMAGAFLIVGANRLMGKLGIMGGLIGGLSARWRGVTVAADAAAAAQARATGMAGGGVVGPATVPGVAGRGAKGGPVAIGPLTRGQAMREGVQSRAAMTAAAAASAPRAGRVSSFLAGRRETRALKAQALYGPWQQREAAAAKLAARPTMAAGAARIAGGALAGAGRFFAPAALLSGAFGAATTQGTFSERASGALSAATMGLYKGDGTRATRRTEDQATAGAAVEKTVGKLPNTVKGNATGVARLNAQIAALRKLDAKMEEVGGGLGGDGKKARESLANQIKVFAEARSALRKQGKALAAIDRENEQIRNAGLREQSRQKALVMLQSFGKAYDTYSKKFGPEKAMDKTVTGVLGKMKQMSPAGAKVLGENTLAWAHAQARANPKLKGAYEDLLSNIRRKFSRTGEHVQVVNDTILRGTSQEWAGIAKSMIDPAERAKQEVSKAFTALQQQAVGSLRAMGFSPTEAKALVTDMEKGGQAGVVAKNDASRGATVAGGRASTAGARQHTGQLAHGGRIAGSGLGDTVAMGSGQMAAPGELVVNRHTEQRLKSKYGVNLAAEVAGERRPHYAPIGGAAPEDRAARAGSQATQSRNATGAGNVSLMGANPALGVYASDAASYGLSVSSGKRVAGGRTSSGGISFHGSGDALDLAGGAGQMLAFARHARDSYGSRLEELIHTPMGAGIKNGQPFTYTGSVAADHFDHVHLADTAPGGVMNGAGVGGGGGMMIGGDGGSMQMAALKTTGSSAKGVAGTLSNVAQKLMAVALTAKVNKALETNGGPGITGGGGGSGGMMGFNSVAALAESVGLPGVTFAQIAKGESGFNPKAVGHDPGGTLGLGLWQITTGFNDDIIKRFGGREAMFNPQINAQAAKAIYDRQGIGAWYGTKYMTGTNLHYSGTADGGSFGMGGDFIATKPQRITVGDGGRERVTVTPTAKKGSGGGGGGTMHVAIHIDGGDAGAVREQVEAALMEVARKLDMSTMETEN